MKTIHPLSLAALTLAATCLATTLAGAAGLSTTDRSVIAMGQGGTGAARADDPAANVYNPAAAAMSPGFAGSIGLMVAKPNVSAQGDGWNSSTTGAATPPLLHLRYGFDTLAFGASLTVPFGTSVSWPSDWPGRFLLQEAKVSVLRASAFGAYRYDRFAFAVGPFVDFGSLQIVRALDFADTEGKAAIDTRATGFGASAAIFWRATDALDVGLSYQSRSKLAFSGYAAFQSPAEFRGVATNQALSTTMRLPDRLTLGALYRISDELNVSADLELTVWSTTTSLVLDFEKTTTPDVVQPRDWRTTVAPRLGATYSPRSVSWLRVRGGAFLDRSPVPSTTLGPSSPDSTRVGLSLGTGFSIFEGASLDVAYQLILLTGASATGDTMPGVRYGGNLQLFGASLTYRFST